jgi:hypothetical protein
MIGTGNGRKTNLFGLLKKIVQTNGAIKQTVLSMKMEVNETVGFARDKVTAEEGVFHGRSLA